jgi:hypothetical protein
MAYFNPASFTQYVHFIVFIEFYQSGTAFALSLATNFACKRDMTHHGKYILYRPVAPDGFA